MFILIVADVPYSFGLNSTDEGATWGDLMNASHIYARWLREFRRLTEDCGGSLYAEPMSINRSQGTGWERAKA